MGLGPALVRSSIITAKPNYRVLCNTDTIIFAYGTDQSNNSVMDPKM